MVKRIVALLLVAVTLMSFAACGKKPVQETPTTAPTEAIVETNAPTEAPTEAPTVAPTTEATVAPTTEATVAPTEPTKAPTQPTNPTQPKPTTPPTQPTTPPTQPTTPVEPTAPSVAPTEPATEPTTEPTEPATEPTEPETEPTEPETEPTEPATEPTEPATEPTAPADPWDEYACISLAEAIAICEKTGETQTTEKYYIRASITDVTNTTYGNLKVTDGEGNVLTIYGTYSADGALRYDKMESKPAAGDEVLLYGVLMNYKNNTPEMVNAWIIDFKTGEPDNDEPAQLPADGSELTVAEILALPVAEGATTTEFYIVKATVESISNATYGSMWINDGTGSVSVYNTKAEDGTFYSEMEDKPYKGDSVTLKCNVQNYFGNIEIRQAYILDFTHADTDVDLNEYTEMTIAAARAAETGTKVKVSGVVAQITYANGFIPSGVILVDNTSSIYVYDGDLAARCAIGDTVTVVASKTYWILETEQYNAEKFGYKGCNQLENAFVIDIHNTNSDFAKNWITETTVKAIMDTPVTEDITTKIFKVTAQVKEVPGNGFTNFYINDLDGRTGTYSYSQCNGNDFTWLREFDGKICTVYVMALNAKSSNSDCYWRFLPIAVVDEGFDPSTVNFAENAVKYYGLGQFLPYYSGNPAMELLTSVNNDLLGYTGAKLSYASSDPSVISIDDNVMNCHKTGTAVITVTAEHNGVTYSEGITIQVEVQQVEENYPTVADAIAAAVNETVTVKGIVGPSLVNQDGFYLVDETGIIAILTDSDTLATLELGYEVVLEGVRFYKAKNGVLGNTCITDAKVLINNYGNHAYSTESFDGVLTLAEFAALDTNTDYTTSVFTVTATVEVVETAYYTNIKLVDGSTSVTLYCSGANQYNWLKQYAGQEITMELAPCNWSSKKAYPACVLAVLHEDGSKTVNTLNFN